MQNTHLLMGDKLHVYRRPESPFWFCSTFLAGKNHRKSTKEESLEHAKRIAEEWYLSLQLRNRAGELKGGKLFSEAAGKFEAEYAALTAGERNASYVKGHSTRIRLYLNTFFGDEVVSDITPQKVQEYRVWRMSAKKHPKTGEVLRPSKTSIHHDIVTLRHILKTAQRHGWIKYIPDLSAPYKASGKVSHRAWFSPEEYKALYNATRARAATPPKKRWRWECEQLHDFVLFMVNTGLRPDEAARIEFRDVEIEHDKATGETILVTSVRGKRGTGYNKSMPGAVIPFERLKQRKRMPKRALKGSWGGGAGQDDLLELPQATDLLFPALRHHHFNTVLDETKMKFDREGNRRSAYSLRHTYICLRLMEGADIYQVAKNCRTSVEMIEKYYAPHIKNMINAAAVNVRGGPSNDGQAKRQGSPKSAKPKKGAVTTKRRQ